MVKKNASWCDTFQYKPCRETLKMFQSQEETIQLPDESENIFKRNMQDKYMDIPNGLYYNVNYAVLNYLWVSTPHVKVNNWQPVEISDKILEKNSDWVYPSAMSLMSSKDKLECGKVPSVLRLFTSNMNKNFELYDHHLNLCYVFLFVKK